MPVDDDEDVLSMSTSNTTVRHPQPQSQPPPFTTATITPSSQSSPPSPAQQNHTSDPTLSLSSVSDSVLSPSSSPFQPSPSIPPSSSSPQQSPPNGHCPPINDDLEQQQQQQQQAPVAADPARHRRVDTTNTTTTIESQRTRTTSHSHRASLVCVFRPLDLIICMYMLAIVTSTAIVISKHCKCPTLRACSDDAYSSARTAHPSVSLFSVPFHSLLTSPLFSFPASHRLSSVLLFSSETTLTTTTMHQSLSTPKSSSSSSISSPLSPSSSLSSKKTQQQQQQQSNSLSVPSTSVKSSTNSSSTPDTLCVWLLVNMIITVVRSVGWVMSHCLPVPPSAPLSVLTFGQALLLLVHQTLTLLIRGSYLGSLGWHIAGIVFLRRASASNSGDSVVAAVTIFIALELATVAIVLLLGTIVFFCAWRMALSHSGQAQGATQAQIDSLPLYRYKKHDNTMTNNSNSSNNNNNNNNTNSGTDTNPNETRIDITQKHSSDNNHNNNSINSRTPENVAIDVSAIPVLPNPQPQSCVICLSDYEPDDLLRLLPCRSNQHAFHKACIDEWLLQNSSCPICRDDPFNTDPGNDGERSTHENNAPANADSDQSPDEQGNSRGDGGDEGNDQSSSLQMV